MHPVKAPGMHVYMHVQQPNAVHACAGDVSPSTYRIAGSIF